jgi:multidrug efflux pump subunit AcrA (membrane-fusion protein)
LKTLLTLAMMVTSTLLFAEYVGSPIKGQYVTYLPEVGTTVKRGQTLFKLDDRSEKVNIKKQKLQLKIALADLEDKDSDLKRSKILLDKKATSLARHENVVVEFYHCLLLTEIKKIEIKQSESNLEDYVGKAFYDCRVIKQMVCVNSGTDAGTYLLEIQPLDSEDSIPINTGKPSKTMKFTAALSGEIISYLPEKDQIVKKDEVLAKLDSSNLKLEIELLETALKEADHFLKDAKTDIERARKLVNDKGRTVISARQYEDIHYLYVKYSIEAAILKLELKEAKDTLKYDFTYRAPYDLKVVKRVVSIGSGSNDGAPMLLVQKL